MGGGLKIMWHLSLQICFVRTKILREEECTFIVSYVINIRYMINIAICSKHTFMNLLCKRGCFDIK